MQRKLLGADHPDVAMTLNNLAFVVHDKGDLKTAIELSRASLDTYTRALGAEHPSVARGMSNLAMWMMEANDFAAAEKLLREALEVRRKRLGPEHADTAATMTLLAGVLIETRRYDEALHARRRCARALSRSRWAASTGGPRVRQAPKARRAPGLKQFDQAEPLLVDSHAVLHGGTGAVTYYLKSSDRWLGRLYQSTGRPDKAAKYLAQAVRSIDHAFDKTSDSGESAHVFDAEQSHRSLPRCWAVAALQARRDQLHAARARAVRRPLLPGRHRQQDQLGSGQGGSGAAHVPGRARSSRDDRLARRRRVRAPAATAGAERAASFAQRQRAVGRRIPGAVRHDDARARVRLDVAERRIRSRRRTAPRPTPTG